ncbi:16S rRNA (guanine966-N2)-methyltransferase [Wenyingzhuangia heitensis]|uniref:16S rRNA (Guanine966-N2)-methyltransferase n=1 Tax=Wenyingzhuangia heitensis TaxID=1487859 RepID=A0ABX0UA52_9FLAO|nr:RsmD family RNA methyltransferase [Wenyingzhuangia heitensis]NIJ45249.1 16S rRNA (guanine966-N2)-methyltransferase [Wenyingzhuangia heitensis]
MRIISGKYKSRRLTAPSNLPVRPTTDMAKEGLFNMINNWYYFNDINVLDLFAGTGNISFEFASRGTEDILSVDKHSGCIYYINKIAKELEFDIDTIKADVFSFLEKHSGTYDVIFADPPYDFSDEQFSKIANLVFENNLLSEEGTLVIEHSQQTDLSNTKYFTQSKRYGGCMFSFFEK